jgi:hypothetical protein
METNKVKEIYSSLVALYQEAPENDGTTFSENGVWDHYHNLIDQLNQATGNDYNICKVNVQTQYHNGRPYLYVGKREYRGKLNDLISRLHTQFFPDESNMTHPQSIPFLQQNINNKTEVETNVYVSLMLTLNNQLHSIKEKVEDDNEKNFVNALIKKVGDIKDFIQFLTITITTATQFGISIERVLELFKIK